MILVMRRGFLCVYGMIGVERGRWMEMEMEMNREIFKFLVYI